IPDAASLFRPAAGEGGGIVRRQGLAFVLGTVSAIAAAASPGTGFSPASGARSDTVLVLQGRTELAGYTGDFDHFAVDLPGSRLFLAAEVHGTPGRSDLRSARHRKSVSSLEPPHPRWEARSTSMGSNTISTPPTRPMCT